MLLRQRCNKRRRRDQRGPLPYATTAWLLRGKWRGNAACNLRSIAPTAKITARSPQESPFLTRVCRLTSATASMLAAIADVECQRSRREVDRVLCASLPVSLSPCVCARARARACRRVCVCALCRARGALPPPLFFFARHHGANAPPLGAANLRPMAAGHRPRRTRLESCARLGRAGGQVLHANTATHVGSARC